MQSLLLCLYAYCVHEPVAHTLGKPRVEVNVNWSSHPICLAVEYFLLQWLLVCEVAKAQPLS